jgi:putative transcriptional regulator
MNAKPTSKVSFRRKRGASFQFSDKERKRLKKTSAAKVEAQALADRDNPPLSEQQLKRVVLAREVRLIREQTGLSQSQFATRFHIGLARLRDFEQARSEPDFVVRVYLRMILDDPNQADRLIKLVERESEGG